MNIFFPRRLLAFSTVALCPLFISARDSLGIYFGTFGNPHSGGGWGMIVHDGWFEMIGYYPVGQRHELVMAYRYTAEIYENGDFLDRQEYLGYTIRGSIEDGSVTGIYTIDGAGGHHESFTGDRDADGGSSALRAEGFYMLRGPESFRGIGRAIVGRSGRFVFLVEQLEGGTNFGASGMLDAAGRASFDHPTGHAGDIVVSADGIMRARVIDRETGAPVILTGKVEVNRLVNLSTRGVVDSEDATMIVGFSIAGTGNKRMLLRVMGPTLAAEPFRLAGTTPDPKFALYRGPLALASVDNWGEEGNVDELIIAMSETGAFPAKPGSKDAIGLFDLGPGSYTMVVNEGSGAAPGIGLAEVYAVNDLTTRDARLVNLSTRGFVGIGDAVMIPGFVTHGARATLLLVRAVGPTLRTRLEVSAVLADPMLRVVKHDTREEVAANDDWDAGDAPTTYSLENAMTLSGAFPLDKKGRDAALLFWAEPNTTYSVVVFGKQDATGVALAEIYELYPNP